MKLYRYVADIDEHFGTCVSLRQYEVVRETRACFVIKFNRKDKFILRDQIGKRFAYTTKKQALNSFNIRSKRRIEILKSQLKHAKEARKCYLNNKKTLLEMKPCEWY
jgi:hypothetical protein